jgi:hypothetical protein
MEVSSDYHSRSALDIVLSRGLAAFVLRLLAMLFPLTPKQVLQKLKTAPLQDVPEAERAFVQK